MSHGPLSAQGGGPATRAVIDRARDERLRPMRTVEDEQDRYDAPPEPVPADHVHRGMDTGRNLDEAVTARLDALGQLDQRGGRRADRGVVAGVDWAAGASARGGAPGERAG